MHGQASKPNLYRGQALPIHELSPSSFENFTYQALSILGKKQGFEMKSGPQPSTDQGYDCTAQSTISKHLICIQCKRYESALSIKTVAEEIVKVSLDKALNGSDPKRHYIITSGEVSGALRKAERQSDYSDLRAECKKIITAGKYQSRLIETAKENSLEPISIMMEYLDKLDDLIIWSGRDFQNELITIWSQLSDILDKNFSIETVLRDSPTPDFDLRAYLKITDSNEEALTPLTYFSTCLPSNLSSDNDIVDLGDRAITIDDLVEILKIGKNVVLSSPGGSGKSSTLTQIKQKIVQPELAIQWLPVKLKLRSYSRNMLSQMIDTELRINYGSWRSLPFKFIFLLDGLDEMLQCDTQALFDDIESTLEKYNYVVTVRDKGLSVGTNSKSIDCCLSIQPLSYRSAFNIANAIFEGDELDQFYEQYRSRLNSVEFDFFSSPFVLSRSIDYYKKNKVLPASTQEIIEDWISSKLKNDQSRVTNSDLKINKLPATKVIETFSTVLYNANFGRGVSSIPEDSYIDLMVSCHDNLITSDAYLAKSLNFDEFIRLITEYEVLYRYADGHYSTPHLIISDYLASKALAKKWREHQISDFKSSHHDIWLYSSNFIEIEDRSDFLTTVFQFDISLAARVARKFQGDFLSDIEEKILSLETSEKVLTRSKAIYALGLLGTENSVRRLRSKQGLIDVQQHFQRRRALALNGDDATLLEILHENEPRAQSPARISGGEYELWFRCPPTKITNLSRVRINEWRSGRQLEACMSLRTLAMFGDSTDCENLIYILENTQHNGEFFDAARALLEIDRNLVCETLLILSNGKAKNSYWSKQVLSSIGVQFKNDKDFEYFIELGRQTEKHLSSQNLAHYASNVVKLLRGSKLDTKQIETLISMYEGLESRENLYYCSLVWQLGLSGEPGCLLPLVKSAYSRKDSSEINNAIWYLSQLTDVEVDQELERAVEEYFYFIDKRHVGIYLHYLRYFSRIKPKKFVMDLVRNKIAFIFKDLGPDNLTANDYNINGIASYGIVFELLSLFVDEPCISIEDSYKLLLINTDMMDQESKLTKLRVLRDLDKARLDEYLNKIQDCGAKICIVGYMLENDLSKDPVILAEQHLSIFLSHHAFYPAIAALCAKHWSDRLASTFLKEFCGFDWNPYLFQLFDRYTEVYLTLLTKEQLKEFEDSRIQSVDEHAERTYRIFLEHHNLEIKKE